LLNRRPSTPNYGGAYAVVPAVGGVAVGTVAGVGLYEGWFGSSAAVAAFPATAAGAAAVGGVAGIGAVALIDAAIQPCRGFQALFLMHREYCAEQAGLVRVPRHRVARH
jgi:hypothetical protein